MSLYDRIAASAPINGTAAIVAGRGTGWNPVAKIQDWYEEQPPLRDVLEYPVDPCFTDFRGMTFGRLHVLGLSGAGTKSSRRSWVCRCRCGCYCTRKIESLKRAMAGERHGVKYMCGRCDYQQALSRGWAPYSGKMKETGRE